MEFNEAQKLSDALAFETKVDLSNCQVDDAAAAMLVECLLADHMHEIKSLDLSHNDIGSKGAWALARLFSEDSQCEIRSLNLRGNFIERDGAVHLLDAISRLAARENTSVHKISLDISLNDIFEPLDERYTNCQFLMSCLNK